MCEGHCAQRSACSAEEFTKRKDMRSRCADVALTRAAVCSLMNRQLPTYATKFTRSQVSALCVKAVSVITGVLVLCARRPLRPARLCFVSYRYGSGRYF